MSTYRFVGARLDDEIILLDRVTCRLIHLTAGAARVWEACGPPAGKPTDGRAAARAMGDDAMSPAGPVLSEFERAEIVRRTDGRCVRVPVEWV
ncbi:MAG TPA: hypothetical protein VGZ23_01305 [bacterium]|nr:hypothetical protein [bacterium]